MGARLLLDCCQAVPNMPVDVRSMGADWIVASAHKMCGPTGIGFLWGRSARRRLLCCCSAAGVLPGGRLQVRHCFLALTRYWSRPLLLLLECSACLSCPYAVRTSGQPRTVQVACALLHMPATGCGLDVYKLNTPH